MVENNLSMEEIENLGYYDFMSYLGVPFFHVGGLKSTEKLAELCHIDKDKKVLVVGCGTGFSACYIAKKFGCFVVGVDIAEISINKAKERAEKENLGDKVEFRIGDAYNLPFEPNTFDVVITEFVSQFLDKDKAFKEFVRVLKPGGYVGINELFKDKDIPPKIAEEIMNAEQIFNDLTQLPFKIYTPEDWKQWLEKAGLIDVQIYEFKNYTSVKAKIRATKELIKAMGGFGKFFKLIIIPVIRVIKYTLSSKIIRNRIKQLEKGKIILMRKKSTSKYVGYILGIGKKI